MKKTHVSQKITAIAKQDNTAWHEFVFWCTARSLTAVPANPWTLAAYARWCEPQLPHKDIILAFKTIYRVHATKSRRRPDRAPILINTLKKIEDQEEKGSRPKVKTVPLFPDGDILKPNQPKKNKKLAPKKSVNEFGGEKVVPSLSFAPKLVLKRKLKN